MKVISGKSILKNLETQHTWIATDFDEKYTGKHDNHNHIIVIAELSQTRKQEVLPLFNELYDKIKHGDEEHQRWLKEAIESFLLHKGILKNI